LTVTARLTIAESLKSMTATASHTTATTPQQRMLVTGASGLVGSHVIARALAEGWTVRALVRKIDPSLPFANSAAAVPGTNGERTPTGQLEWAVGDLSQPRSLVSAVQDVTTIVHCAAKVGDWGPIDGYREINVHGLRALIQAAEATGKLQRVIHLSSLGVYSAEDHYGTDESVPCSRTGIDGYTLTKVEAEQFILDEAQHGLPAVVLRPGFIYGPRDRTILPRLLQRLRSRQFAYLGSPEKVMNNTYVGNLVQAVFLALSCPTALGHVYNITDGRLVTKREFIETIAKTADLPIPTGIVPLPVAKTLATVLETAYRWLGKTEGPLLSRARIKFLGLNLDYSIDRAKRELGYQPLTDFAVAMPDTVRWFLEHERSETERLA
jgi:2-alkyl-3-oxoalkanoate reductase